jgi:hypothetical protein
MKNLLLSFFILLFFAPSGFAQSNQRKHILVFSARSASLSPYFSLTGHAWVAWKIVHHLKKHKQTIQQDTVSGFVPKDAHPFLAELLFSEIDGKIAYGTIENQQYVEGEQIECEVDSTTWHKTLAASSAWSDKNYSLLRNNCISFTNDIATKSGLRTPKLTNIFGLPKTPVTYLRQLKRMNKRKFKQKNY